MTPAQTVIGIDLDNTLVCYDELFHLAACEEGLIDPSFSKSKEKIRDVIRLLPKGENQWTRLQAIVYGPRMPGATAFPGVRDFLRHCAEFRVKAWVVSHKTQFAMLDGRPVDLRQSALEWMKAERLLDSRENVLRSHNVFFESTREEKIERIGALGCTHFIDDLAEVFAEYIYPRETAKLLFAPHGTSSATADVRVFKTWQELDQFFFS